MNPRDTNAVVESSPPDKRGGKGYGEPWPLPDVKTRVWCNVVVWMMGVSAVLLVVAWIVGTVYILSVGTVYILSGGRL